ncbi:hypothetical protein A7U60_g3589 [Sanghuangporus baumii]|uniref:Uncharacterized protein n=1 Tax=Sanghuangporus baumii TaxID=108892 RepID=A0A9Q5N6L6_SANBA|nr:hypothetical protein A7U60_g3589 [Sanghuangporus baumii]
MSTDLFRDTMSSTQDLIRPNELPPFSPVVYKPQVKYSYTFDTEYSRDPARIRAVFDELVAKTKELNLCRPDVPVAKRRARNLGLKVNIEQAKGLHWRSIQARRPVVLTAGPISPPRTPRRPATDYPSAEQLCLKNTIDAQRKQNYAEACRWSYLAERERTIRKWEAEQAIAFRARQALDLHSTVARHQESRTTVPGNRELEWQKPLSSSESTAWLGEDSRMFTDSSHASESRYQTVIEMPVHPMDRSQSIEPEATNSNYLVLSHDQMQSFNIPHGSHSSISNVRLARSSSIQRHIPATSLRLAPMPLRPRIDHHPLSYPTPQATRLSYVQPIDVSAPGAIQNSSDNAGYPVGLGLDGLPSSRTTVSLPSTDPTSLDQTFDDDEYSLKKRRSEAEHVVSQRNEQRKLR